MIVFGPRSLWNAKVAKIGTMVVTTCAAYATAAVSSHAGDERPRDGGAARASKAPRSAKSATTKKGSCSASSAPMMARNHAAAGSRMSGSRDHPT